jgi:hypothetical protein
MTTNFEITRQTKANISDTMHFWTHPEYMAQVYPDMIKQITIKSKDENTVTYEFRGEFMGRKMVSVNRTTFNKDARTVIDEIIEGSGKGSKMTHSFKELPNGTEDKYSAAMEMGPLGFLGKGAWKSAVEKGFDEAVKRLDAKSSRREMTV